MKLNLNGVEIELPNNAKVDVSKDGKKVKIELPELEASTEKIRVVEVPGEVSERIIERIKIVEVEKPCTRQHYNPWVTYTYPYTITTGGSMQGNTSICNQPSSTITWTGQAQA